MQQPLSKPSQPTASKVEEKITKEISDYRKALNADAVFHILKSIKVKIRGLQRSLIEDKEGSG